MSGEKAAEEGPGAPPRVLHYVQRALPLEVGYTLRTHAIATELARRGCAVAVATPPRRGRGGPGREGRGEPVREDYDGVRYLRPGESAGRGRSGESAGRGRAWAARIARALGARRAARRLALVPFARWLEEACGGRPAILHTHGSPRLARDAETLAAELGARRVFEVRGFSKLSRAAVRGRAIDARAAVRDEVTACVRADRVVAICRGIADALVRGGVPARRITRVPNGVDVGGFARPPDPDVVAALADRLALEGRVVFGTATNVRRLEGLQVLVEAWPEVLRRLPEAVFLVLGDGDYREPLAESVRAAGLGESFRLLGRVPFEAMRAHYALLDVFVVPRIPEPVCEIVTPLKPLEAMAAGVPVVASDVAALREMVEDGVTGALFRAGDAGAAAEVCAGLGLDVALRARLASRARAWVAAERDWSMLGGRYAALYRDLCAADRAGGGA